MSLISEFKQIVALLDRPSACYHQTHSGKQIYPLDPDPEDICLEDVAHALSNMCRFQGHTKEFYSVAQHSVLVAGHCSRENKLYGLLHDASEAYLSDISRPVKYSPAFDAYRKAEKHLQSVIYQKFGLEVIEPLEVKVHDRRALATERRDLIACQKSDWQIGADPYLEKIIPWPPAKAKKLFLKMYNQLRGIKHPNPVMEFYLNLF